MNTQNWLRFVKLKKQHYNGTNIGRDIGCYIPCNTNMYSIDAYERSLLIHACFWHKITLITTSRWRSTNLARIMPHTAKHFPKNVISTSPFKSETYRGILLWRQQWVLPIITCHLKPVRSFSVHVNYGTAITPNCSFLEFKSDARFFFRP